jgi:hypothetical protein
MIFGASSYRSSKIWNLLGENPIMGHTTITATERFYNRRLSIDAPAPHVNS